MIKITSQITEELLDFHKENTKGQRSKDWFTVQRFIFSAFGGYLLPSVENFKGKTQVILLK